ncbi:flippase-like domain-containing protein [Crassaminicella thermophila]|uniref:Phosphatidylglycerol lysyltransferase n=1 Tax=Crassaminicella thermophila TaxID=2599308 RepID=A0A5C0SIJ0_CRATE|nr:lysylphosphatidylglycerol synthase transmembrane domain-containing protein [Crassaminicella thermophila]QEK13254.1 flippase-like domain-containing protein [Crassaminicella thermophila]
MDFYKIKKGLFISLIIGIIVFAGLSIYSDINDLINVFVAFKYHYIPLILLLAPLNYFFRYIKWTYYLNLINVKINKKDNLFIFLSGLCMTITPGKLGELLKSYLLKEKANVPISSTAPLVMGERLTDGISMLILASIGSLAYNYGRKILIFVLLGMLLFIIVVQSPKIMYSVLRFLNRIPFLRRFGPAIKNFYDNAYIILKLKPLLFAISIGVVSWFFEGLVIYLTGKALEANISLLASVFTVSFSSIVGAISMMPGGLFATEGSIMGLLLMMGLNKDMAVATTIITRFSTLWLGVCIGLFGLAKTSRSIEKRYKMR